MIIRATPTYFIDKIIIQCSKTLSTEKIDLPTAFAQLVLKIFHDNY